MRETNSWDLCILYTGSRIHVQLYCFLPISYSLHNQSESGVGGGGGGWGGGGSLLIIYSSQFQANTHLAIIYAVYRAPNFKLF